MTMLNKPQTPKEFIGLKSFFALASLTIFCEAMAFEDSIPHFSNEGFQDFRSHCRRLFSNSIFYEKTCKNLKSRFDEKTYMEKYRQDVIESDLAPFEHFLNTVLSGKVEPFINTSFEQVLNNLEKKVQEASQEEWYVNIDKNKEILAPYFDEAFYQETYRNEINQSGISTFDHFMYGGWQKGYKPTSWFETSLYQKYFPCEGNPFLDWISQPIGINTTEKREKELIVSLTSYPARDHVSWMAIESILRQTVRPDRIILWLYEGQYPDGKIPQALEILKPRGLEVRFYHKDLKGGKKLRPALEAFPNAVIVVADDDNFLTSDWLENLYNAHLKEPDVIYAHLARELRINPDGYLAPYHEWPYIKEKFYHSDRLLPIGAGGILYPPNSFDSEIYNEEAFLEICSDQDDLWACVMKKKERKIKTCKYFNLKSFETSQKEGLWNTVNSRGANDVAIQRLNSRYNLGLPFSHLSLENFPFHFLRTWARGYKEFENSLNLKFNFQNSIKLFGLYQSYPNTPDQNSDDDETILLKATGCLDINFLKSQHPNFKTPDLNIAKQFIEQNLKRPNFAVNGLSYSEKRFLDIVSSSSFSDYYSLFKPTYEFLTSRHRLDLLKPLASSMEIFSNLSYQESSLGSPLIPLEAHRLWLTSQENPSEVAQEMLDNYWKSYHKTQRLNQHFWCLDPSKIPQTINFIKSKMPKIKIRKIEELFQSDEFKGKNFFNILMEKNYFTLASDIVRANILYQEGGFYSNIGNTLWMDITPLLSMYEFIIYCRPNIRFWDTNFMASPPKSNVLDVFLTRLENWSGEDDTKTAFCYGAHGFLGAPLITNILQEEWLKGLKLLVLPDFGGPFRNHSSGSWYGKGKGGNVAVKRSMFLELNPQAKMIRHALSLDDAIQENQNLEFLRSNPISVQIKQDPYQDAALIMVFKDEEDIIFENLCWHYTLGLRKFFLMNNASQDTSLEKVEKFQKIVGKDVSVFILQDPITEFIQGDKITGAIKFVQEVFPNLKWALPTDADEFWCPVASLEDIFSRVPEDVDAIFCRPSFYHSSNPKTFLDLEAKKPFYENLTVKTSFNPYSPNEQRIGKSIIKLPLKNRVLAGNHFIISQGTQPVGNYLSGNALGIHLREYSIRSFNQFKKKVVNKGIAKEKAVQQGLRFATIHLTEERYRLYKQYGDVYLEKEFEKAITAPLNSCEDPLPIEEAIESVTRKTDSCL